MYDIKVSICCLTYNHESFLAQTLDSFLMQKTNFDFEILIHDDASTDRTPEIIKEYQKRYPDIIKPILQTENKWSQGITALTVLFNIPRAKGKYIAMCEGDDYWTERLKLQKQVDFLDSKPDYTFICGGYISSNITNNKKEIILKDLSENDIKLSKCGFDITFERMKKEWLTKTLTVLYRKDAVNWDIITKYKYARDVHIFYHLLKKGKGFYLKEILGVYNIHDGGIFSLTSKLNKLKLHYRLYQELYFINKDDYSRFIYLLFNLKLLNYKISFRRVDFDLSIFKLIKNSLLLTRTMEEFNLLIKYLVPQKLKKIILNKDL